MCPQAFGTVVGYSGLLQPSLSLTSTSLISDCSYDLHSYFSTSCYQHSPSRLYLYLLPRYPLHIQSHVTYTKSDPSLDIGTPRSIPFSLCSCTVSPSAARDTNTQYLTHTFSLVPCSLVHIAICSPTAPCINVWDSSTFTYRIMISTMWTYCGLPSIPRCYLQQWDWYSVFLHDDLSLPSMGVLIQMVFTS